MAQSSFPFENIDTTETQFSQMFRNFQNGVNGAYGGTDLTVSAGSGLSVDVNAGQAMVRGHYYISTAVENLVLATADATNDRLDTIVLRLDPTANSIVLAVKTGTPAGSPTAPTLVQTDAGIYEMAIANVLVQATAGVPGAVTDRREFMGSNVGMWSDSTRPTSAKPHVGYNTTQQTFEGYDPVTATWGPIGGGGGGLTISATAPSAPEVGALWWDSDNGAMYVYYDDGNTEQWVAASGGQVTIADAAPAGYNGQLWWNSLEGKLYVFYDDGNSSAWVAAGGPQVTVQATAPAGYQGQMWLDSSDGSMYVYYTDPGGGSSSWIGAVSRSGGVLQVLSATKTDAFSTTSTSFVDVTGLSVSITPRSTSSKIMVSVSINVSQTVGYAVIGRLVRDTTPLAIGDDSGLANQQEASFQSYESQATNQDHKTITYLDSPSSTSTLTYKVQINAGNGATAYVNRSQQDEAQVYAARTVSSITVMEIAG